MSERGRNEGPFGVSYTGETLGLPLHITFSNCFLIACARANKSILFYKIAKVYQKTMFLTAALYYCIFCVRVDSRSLLLSTLSLRTEFAMQLTNILIAAVAVLANADCHHPHYYDPNQQNKAAQAVGSGTNGNSGSGNGYGSNSGTTDTGSGSGSGITSNNGYNATSSGSQFSGSTGTYGNDASNVAPQGSQSSGLNAGTNKNVLLKAAAPNSQSSGYGSTNSGSTSLGTTNSGSTNSGSTDLGSTNSGTTNSGSTNPGSTNPGSTNSGSTNSGFPSTSLSNSAGGSTASFTQYGPCRRTSVACGWYSRSGYNAAISQAVYGGGPGSGATRECGVCWKLTPDASGANEIVVKINDLCPDDGNPLCAQPAGEFFFSCLSSFVLHERIFHEIWDGFGGNGRWLI